MQGYMKKDNFYRNLEKKIVEFCSYYSHIYIYGAGTYGKAVYKFLRFKGLNVCGCITTDGKGQLDNLPMLNGTKLRVEEYKDAGIILAVKEQFENEIVSMLGDSYNYLRFKKDEFGCFQYEDIYNLISMYKKDNILCQELKIKNILIIQLEVTFGDMIWSTGLIRELYRNFENANITLVLNEKFASLFRECPYVNRMVFYPAESLLEEANESMRLKAEKFAKENFSDIQYDVVFLPRLLPEHPKDSFENVFLALSSNANYKVAHAMYIRREQKNICDIYEEKFTNIIKHDYPEHDAMYHLRLLEGVFGIIRNDKMELWYSAKEKEFVNSYLKDISNDKILIALGLVGSKGNRTWKPEKYAGVVNKIYQKYGDNVLFVLIGGENAIINGNVIQELTGNRCLDMTGKTDLLQCEALIDRCSFYVGADTGIMHMASAFNKPIIEISAAMINTPYYYGATPLRTGPWRVPAIVLQPEKGLEGCKYVCAKDSHCINQISEEDVYQAIEEFINII